jgi:subtilisin family serine protease
LGNADHCTENKMNMKILTFVKALSFATFLTFSISMNAQSVINFESAPEDWFHRDIETDKIPGVSTMRAYELVRDRQPKKPIVVAVIDSGVDIAHEDLREVVWTNEDEITGNGIDDDGNGYVDDIHGWSFIGGPTGDVHYDNLEFTRVYKSLLAKYKGKSKEDISKENMEEFEKFQSMKKQYVKRVEEAEANMQEMAQVVSVYEMADKTFAQELGEDYTAEDLADFEPEDPRMGDLKQFVLHIKQNNLEDRLRGGYEHFQQSLEYSYDLEFDPRELVGDNYQDKTERHYGNNHITGPAAEHGTHVAGIIAAQRDNGIGMDGIAGNAQIMVLRAVPMGDERDKDVANAIYYAVDNGANIINMSFGKSYSPYKEVVDQAVQYAQEKGVLLIHAAGNSSKDNDSSDNFPNAQFRNSKEMADNWIEVGASTFQDNESLVASFSNYGRKTVDLFAPGMDIYSTVPGSEYKNNSGTSMAAPVVAGVAALVWSYFPELTADELREVIIDSCVDYRKLKVTKPGSQQQASGEEGEKTKVETIKFKKLSKTGGVVNAYHAMQLAQKVADKKK